MSNRIQLADLPRRYQDQAVPQLYVLTEAPKSANPAIMAAPKSLKTTKDSLWKTLPRQSESKSQQALIRWWDGACPRWSLSAPLLMGFPLQGARTKANGSRLKAEGMRKGTPDLFLAVPRGDRSGLWLEMKSPTGKVTSSQADMMQVLVDSGYAAVVCRSTEEAEKAIITYLSIK